MGIIYFIVGLTVVAAILYGINRYVFRKLIAHDFHDKATFIAMFVMPITYIASHIINRSYPNKITEELGFISAFWFAIILYLVIFALIDDIFRIIVKIEFKNKKPFAVIYRKSIMKFILRNRYKLFVFVFMPILLIYGHLNAVNPRISYEEVEINQNCNKDLNIVFISDVHLGSINDEKYIAKLVKEINTLHPDILLLGGDILDGDVEAVDRKGLMKYFDDINTKYGIFAVTGNHEYIGGIEKSKYVLSQSNGIKLLEDEYILIDSLFWVVGRKDKMAERKEGRKLLEDIVPLNKDHYPVILLDHQPFKLEESHKAGIDVQLSGHTHNGQIFPVNFITSLIYDISWGYKKIGGTHYYVSCGVGTWGPNVRFGSYSEIVNIKLKW